MNHQVLHAAVLACHNPPSALGFARNHLSSVSDAGIGHIGVVQPLYWVLGGNARLQVVRRPINGVVANFGIVDNASCAHQKIHFPLWVIIASAIVSRVGHPTFHRYDGQLIPVCFQHSCSSCSTSSVICK